MGGVIEGWGEGAAGGLPILIANFFHISSLCFFCFFSLSLPRVSTARIMAQESGVGGRWWASVHVCECACQHSGAHRTLGREGPRLLAVLNWCHPSCFHSSQPHDPPPNPSPSPSPAPCPPTTTPPSTHSPQTVPLQSRGPVLGSRPDHTLNCHLLCAQSPSPAPRPPRSRSALTSAWLASNHTPPSPPPPPPAPRVSNAAAL